MPENFGCRCPLCLIISGCASPDYNFDYFPGLGVAYSWPELQGSAKKYVMLHSVVSMALYSVLGLCTASPVGVSLDQ